MKIVEDLDVRSESLAATPTAFAKSSLLYIQFIGHYYTLPRYSIERDGLNSYLFLYTLGGTGYLKYDGRLYQLNKGMIFLIDCRKYHLYYTDSNDLWEFLFVHFDGKTAEDYVNYFMKQNGPVVYADPDLQVMDLVNKLQELQRDMDERSDIMSSYYLVKLLTGLLLTGFDGYGEKKPLPPYIAQIKRSLHERFQHPLRLDDLAREFAISKFHLSREFKKYTGYSPYDYLLNIRMKAAKELLQSTDMSIENISSEVGFSNPNHFIQLFRKREGITPLQYRKKWRGK